MEREQLDGEEYVLRRIHKSMVHAGPPTAIGFVGFRPTGEDSDGLSVHREKFVSASDLAAAGRKPGEYYVVRLRVADLQLLGMKVVADDVPGATPGHALIPELSVEACLKDKRRTRELQIRMAGIASAFIVHVPER